jgi:hypothetical protein
MTEHSVRLTDIFTNAAAIADYTGAMEVEPAHLLEALECLRAGRPWQLPGDERPRSPLGRSGFRAAVPAPIQALARDWFQRLDNDPLAALDAAALDDLAAEIARIGS